MDEEPNLTPYAVVVDDDALIRMGARELLQDAGFRVFEAESADAANDLLQEHQESVVLLFTDVEMPGRLDGFALARLVAASWPHISIVVASGSLSPHLDAMPPKARFIPKPFSVRVVYTHLQEILPDGQKPAPLKARA